MAELADAHGSGPCDSNIMRVQVPSSARRLKSKDLSLFLVSHQQSRDAAAPKGPRVSSGFRQSHLSLHTLPFPSLIPPIHSADGHPGTDEPGWRELRGTLPESREASAPGGPSARNSHHYEPLPKKRKKPPRQITSPERFFLFSSTN